MVGYVPNTIAEPKYRLVAVATSERVHVFAEPYLVDTLTELFPLMSGHKYAVLLDLQRSYCVVDAHGLLWAVRPDWSQAIPGTIGVASVEAAESFATLEQAITYLSSELHDAEVVYFTQKESMVAVSVALTKRAAQKALHRVMENIRSESNE